MELRSSQLTFATPCRPSGVRRGRGRATALALLALSAVAIFLLLPATGYAATFGLVREQWNCLQTTPALGRSALPFCTIGAGASHLGPGVTVHVAAGSYAEAVTGDCVWNVGGTRRRSLLRPRRNRHRRNPWVRRERAELSHDQRVHRHRHDQRSCHRVPGRGDLGHQFESRHDPGQHCHRHRRGRDLGPRLGPDHDRQQSRHDRRPRVPLGRTAVGIRLQNSTDSVVSNNEADHNTNHGIYLYPGSTGNQVIGNTVHDNAPGLAASRGGHSSSTGHRATRSRPTSATTTRTAGSPSMRARTTTLRPTTSPTTTATTASTTPRRPACRSSRTPCTSNYRPGSTSRQTSTAPATIANNISVDNGLGIPAHERQHPRRG